MKNKFKSIAAAIMISGLFFIPVFCSAQVAGGGSDFNPSTNIVNPPENDNNDEEEESSSQTDTETLILGTLAAPFIPGGSVISAAISGLGRLKDSLGG